MNKDKWIKMGGLALVAVALLFVGGRMFNHMNGGTFGTVGQQQEVVGQTAVITGDVQEVSIDLQTSGYTPIIVQKGIPVKFNIRATSETINSCNGTVVISEFGQKIDLQPGDNILEFTPTAASMIPYSCWMGMINSSITVVDDLSKADSGVIAGVATGSGAASCCQPK